MILSLLRLLPLCMAALLLAASGWASEPGTPDEPVPDEPVKEEASPAGPVRVLSVELEAGISPVQLDLLNGAIDEASAGGFDLIFLRLDTPGGLVNTMREMVKSILASPVEVAIWVGPSGARAASAGVFLVAAAHHAGMSPATSIGAASPVTPGGDDVPETAAKKVMNDLMALVRGVADTRGRNVEWYAKAVEEAVSATAKEAEELNVIDFVAETPQEALAAIGQRGVGSGEAKRQFEGADVQLVEYDPGVRYSILEWLLDPQVAYFLLLAGLAGLFFELQSPGILVPGVLGALCLLMGLYALSVLPTNVAGLLLILLGLGLFVLEAYVTSLGFLAVAGMVAMFYGSTILFRDVGGFPGLPLTTIFATVATTALLLGLVGFSVAKAQMRKPSGGLQDLVGRQGQVKVWQDGQGQVFVRGELWAAVASKGESLPVGQQVRVVRADGLILVVDVQTAETNEHM